MSFRPNPKLAALLQATPEAQAQLRAAAETVRPHAEAIAERHGAPWMARKGKQTFAVDQTATGVVLVNTDHAGHLLEWGSVNNPPHAPLRRAVRAAGLRFIER